MDCWVQYPWVASFSFLRHDTGFYRNPLPEVFVPDSRNGRRKACWTKMVQMVKPDKSIKIMNFLGGGGPLYGLNPWRNKAQ